MNPLLSAASVSHYTPADWCEDFRYALGGRIALDPASNEFANRVVGADVFLTSKGLETPWHGPLLLNPPGKSPENPKGAAAWWAKLVTEWERGQRSWSAIFVGFSLEILQTAQSYDCLQPGDFPHAVPDKRICFDVETAVLLAKLRHEYSLEEARSVTFNNAKLISLGKRLQLIEVALARGEERFPGDSPTHGNVIVCLAHDVDTMERFYERMEKRGWTDRKVRCR